MNKSKLKQIQEIIDSVLCVNWCEDDYDAYVNYLEHDIKRVEVMRTTNTIDKCLADHIIEEVWTLISIINIVKGGK